MLNILISVELLTITVQAFFSLHKYFLDFNIRKHTFFLGHI